MSNSKTPFMYRLPSSKKIWVKELLWPIFTFQTRRATAKPKHWGVSWPIGGLCTYLQIQGGSDLPNTFSHWSNCRFNCVPNSKSNCKISTKTLPFFKVTKTSDTLKELTVWQKHSTSISLLSMITVSTTEKSSLISYFCFALRYMSFCPQSVFFHCTNKQ